MVGVSVECERVEGGQRGKQRRRPLYSVQLYSVHIQPPSFKLWPATRFNSLEYHLPTDHHEAEFILAWCRLRRNSDKAKESMYVFERPTRGNGPSQVHLLRWTLLSF